MAGEFSLKDTSRGLLNFIPELIKPQLRGYIDSLNKDEYGESRDFEWDMDATEQTKRNALKYLLNQGLRGATGNKFGLSSGIGIEYNPNERSRYYAEKRPGGFQVGGTINF